MRVEGEFPEEVGEPFWYTRALLERDLWDPTIVPTREFFRPMSLERVGSLEGRVVHFYCGIANDRLSVREGGYRLKEALGEGFSVQPHWVHKESLACGLGEVVLEKGCQDVSTVQKMVLGWALVFGNLMLRYSDVQTSIDFVKEHLTKEAQRILTRGCAGEKQEHVAFSNGGYVFKEALKQLPQAYRDTVVVVTVGSTAIIESGLAYRAYNLIGDKDWPSRLCNGGEAGLLKKAALAQIEIVPQEEVRRGIGGHYFVQPQYQMAIAKILLC
jgi:hypothetical protein